MGKHKIYSGLTSLALATAMTASLSVPAFATTASEKSVPVEVEVSAATFSIEVPTSLPIGVNAKGEVTVAEEKDCVITNNSAGPVCITDVAVESSNDWTQVASSTDFTTFKVNSKNYSLKINDVETLNDSDDLVAASFGTKIDTGASKTFNYSAKLSTQTAEVTQQIANVVFTIGWYKEAEVVKQDLELTVTTSVNQVSSAVGTVIVRVVGLPEDAEDDGNLQIISYQLDIDTTKQQSNIAIHKNAGTASYVISGIHGQAGQLYTIVVTYTGSSTYNDAEETVEIVWPVSTSDDDTGGSSRSETSTTDEETTGVETTDEEITEGEITDEQD
jgi:hypothetical protein